MGDGDQGAPERIAWLPVEEEARLLWASRRPVLPDFCVLCALPFDAESRERSRILAAAGEALQAYGVTWWRFTLDDALGGAWVEGWIERPEGDCREADFRPEFRWRGRPGRQP